jgi:hypothetical protein
VIGRIEDGRVVLDLRTIEPERDGELEAAVRSALAGLAGAGGNAPSAGRSTRS